MLVVLWSFFIHVNVASLINNVLYLTRLVLFALFGLGSCGIVAAFPQMSNAFSVALTAIGMEPFQLFVVVVCAFRWLNQSLFWLGSNYGARAFDWLNESLFFLGIDYGASAFDWFIQCLFLLGVDNGARAFHWFNEGLLLLGIHYGATALHFILVLGSVVGAKSLSMTDVASRLLGFEVEVAMSLRIRFRVLAVHVA